MAGNSRVARIFLASFFMSSTALARVFISLLLASSALYPARAHAQTATDIVSTRSSLSYTFDNASGFSITNNGTMDYKGPLNQLKGSPCCTSALLSSMGQDIEISSEDYEADTGLKAQKKGGNTLSAMLKSASIPVDEEIDQVGLQYLVFIGGTTRIEKLESYTEQEKVDAQSLSIFPQYTSVFP